MLTVLNIILVFLLVLANGFFVASEFALVGVRRSRIETLADAGDRRATRLMRLLRDLNAYISATQLGITLASLGLGWIGEPAIAHLLEAPLEGIVTQTQLDIISFTVAFGIITFLHIVLGELAPKTLALERAERVALSIAWPMEAFYKVFRWPIRLLDWAGTRTVRLFGLKASGEHGSSYTEAELRQLIEASTRSGHLDTNEQQLLNRIFDFAEAEVREAMVPRPKIIALSVKVSLEEAEKVFLETGYSRLPVYRETLDDVIGVLFLKDIIPYLHAAPDKFELEKLLRPPMFVPDSARLGAVLTRMRAAQSHIAFIVDEHGGIEGLVTLEDLLEEIVGEINDEYDQEMRAQVIEDNGAYLLDGMLAVRDANRRFKLHLPEESGYTTLAGFMLAQAGRLLHPGEMIEHDGARFKVERVDGRRIRRIRYTPAASQTVEQLSVALYALAGVWLATMLA